MRLRPAPAPVWWRTRALTSAAKSNAAQAYSTRGWEEAARALSQPDAPAYVDALEALSASTRPTRVTVVALYNSGLGDPDHLLLNSRFIHRELVARRSAMLLQLLRFPDVLARQPEVSGLTELYRQRLCNLLSRPMPGSAEEAVEFECHLRENVPQQDGETRRAFGAALKRAEEDREGSPLDRETQLEIDVHMDAFFGARVGLRFLAQHYLHSVGGLCWAVRFLGCTGGDFGC